MDIHKPKPWHGWREFLKEYVIIVVGVLTALAAEQSVGTIHNRMRAAEARELIRGELEFNLARLRSRIELRGCVQRRIEEVQTLLDGAAENPAIITPRWIGRPSFWSMQTHRWQASAQAGEAALLNRDELEAYGLEYTQLRVFEEDLATEQTDWAKLRTLEHLRRLDAQSAFELNATLQDARYRDWRAMRQAEQILDRAQAMRLRVVPNTTLAPKTICFPITTPRAEALRLAGARSIGEP
jgi:hypothetical protein